MKWSCISSFDFQILFLFLLHFGQHQLWCVTIIHLYICIFHCCSCVDFMHRRRPSKYRVPFDRWRILWSHDSHRPSSMDAAKYPRTEFVLLVPCAAANGSCIVLSMLNILAQGIGHVIFLQIMMHVPSHWMDICTQWINEKKQLIYAEMVETGFYMPNFVSDSKCDRKRKSNDKIGRRKNKMNACHVIQSSLVIWTVASCEGHR